MFRLVLSICISRCFIFCFVCAELYFPSCTSRFVFVVCISRCVFPVWYFRFVYTDCIFNLYSPEFVLSDLCFPVLFALSVFCAGRFQFFTPLHVLQFGITSVRKLHVVYHASKKLHAFARACDACVCNVHFCNNSRNGLESK